MIDKIFISAKKKSVYLYTSLFLLFVALAYNVVAFTEYTSAIYVQRDGWRFIDIYLIPYYNGEFSFKTLFSDPLHAQPIVAILQILNAKYFSLNMKYEAFFGVFFIFLVTLLMIKTIFNSLFKVTLIFKFFLLSCTICILLSIGSIEKLTWSLVTLSYIPTFFVILISIYFNKSIKEDTSKKHKLYIFLFLLMLFLIQKDSGIILIGALIISLFIVYFLNLKKYKPFLFGLVVIFILFKLIMIYIDIPDFPKTQVNPLDAMLSIFQNPLTFLNSVSVTYLSPLINFEYVLDTKLLTSEQYIFLSYIPFGFSLFIVYYYIKYKIFLESTLVPLVIYLYSLLFILAVILFRYPPTDESSIYLVSSLRYISVYELMIVCVIWMGGLLYMSEKFTKQRQFIKYAAVVVFIIFILSIYNTSMSWRKGYYINFNNKNVIQSLREYTPHSIYPPWVHTQGKIKESHIEFLKRHRLNVFNKEQ